MIKIKLANTGLERNRKLTTEDKKQIKKYYKSGYTQSSLAIMYGVSPSAIHYALLSNKAYKEFKQKSNERKHTWYMSHTPEERSELGKRWNESHNRYIEELLLTKLNNI